MTSVRSTFVVLIVLFLPALAVRAAAPASAPASSGASGALGPVIQKLVAESGYLLPVNPSAKDPPVFARPHRHLAPLVGKPGLALEAAKRMTERFTGDINRDLYVRWHLVPFILEMSPEEMKTAMPDLLKALKATPEYPKSLPPSKAHPQWEDPVLAVKWHGLRNQTSVTVGFPPFQRLLWPPESFEHMTAAQKARADAAIAEMKTMTPPKYKAGTEDAPVWNHRLTYLRIFLGQYRIDLMYAMVRSGIEAGLDVATNEVAGKAKSSPVQAHEAIIALNLCLREGTLSRYDTEKLKGVAGVLRRAATSNRAQFKHLNRSGITLPASVLHLVCTIEAGRVPKEPALDAPAAAIPPATTQVAIKADQITIEAIDSAIARGVQYLHKPLPVRPPLAHLDSLYAQHFWFWQPTQYGLIAWALLSTGQPFQNPQMQEHLNHILSWDTDYPYDLATRLQVLSHLPEKGWEPWVRRDTELVAQAITAQGNFSVARTGTARDEFGNNADGAYGVMGLWVGHRRGDVLKPEVWDRIDRYWRKAQLTVQNDRAGWGLYTPEAIHPSVDKNAPPYSASGPMTAVGIMSLSRIDHVLRSEQRLEVGQGIAPEIRLGLNWLDKYFSFDDMAGDTDNVYYMWTIQQLGQATGYRTFNKVDWFRDATSRMLSSQALNGAWTGPKGEKVSTAFALLYLARARGPLAICKLELDEVRWNNRPADLFNLTEYFSNLFEVPTSWQISDLNQPVYELIESPLLYLATDKPFTLKQEHVVRLREYVEAGGMLVCAPEGKAVSGPTRSMKALATQLFPGQEFKRLTDRKHPFFTLQQKVQGAVPVSVIERAGRPLVVMVEKDISRDLQADQAKGRDSFKMLCNVYLYATGQDVRRPRIQTNYLVRGAAGKGDAALRPMEVARVKTAGEFNPEPGALSQLSVLMANRHGIDLRAATCAPRELTGKEAAFLTVTSSTTLGDDEASALRKWVEGGGTLWVDAIRGAALSQLDTVLARLEIKSEELVELPSEHPILAGGTITGGYDNRNPAMRRYRRELTGAPPLAVADVNGRPAVYVSRYDLTSGLAGLNHWEIIGPDPKFARQIVVNGMLFARESEAAPAATLSSATQPSTQPSTQSTTRPSNP
ncbi:MAG: DUF4159 domain-containing protein [Tepidisphaeraceae bacterium]